MGLMAEQKERFPQWPGGNGETLCGRRHGPGLGHGRERREGNQCRCRQKERGRECNPSCCRVSRLRISKHVVISLSHHQKPYDATNSQLHRLFR